MSGVASDAAVDGHGAGKVLLASRAAERARLTDDLESAAIRLRDAELAKQKAGKEYAEALDAFNRFVAPVVEGKL